MPRILFEKRENAVWISHLDLMRVFQRAFKRAGLPLTHSKGFNPRPSVSIALPLSVGIESRCELLDFDLEGLELPMPELVERLNASLIRGVRVLEAYDQGRKLRDLALLSCCVTLEYDGGIPAGAESEMVSLFSRAQLLVEKKGKNGPVDQDIIPMLRNLEVVCLDGNTMELRAVVCCQNPSLNPMQLSNAIDRYLPQYKPDFVTCRREEIYDGQMNVFR